MNFTIDRVKALLTSWETRTLSVERAFHTVVEVQGSPNLVIKCGAGIWKTEALAMQLVSERTSVPVPKLFAYLSESPHIHPRRGYIVMKMVPGQTLDTVVDTLDAPAIEAISKQLAEYLSELRKLDGEGWGMPGKGGMYHRTRFSYSIGPSRFTSTKEFINYFVRAAQRPLPENDDEVKVLLRDIDLTRPPVFSHGDLLPENIMYDVSSGRITGIIDWECAGYYPYFWDHYVASRRSQYSENWERIYSSVMENCTAESRIFGKYYNSADSLGSFESPFERCSCCE